MFRFLSLLAVTIALIIPAADCVAPAKESARPWYELRSIYTIDYGLENPGGMIYSPGAKAFLLWRDDGSVVGAKMDEDIFDTQSLTIAVEDARNLAFDGNTNSLFILSQGGAQLEEFSLNEGGLPETATEPTRKHNVKFLNLQSARGITFDPVTGRLFVLNAEGRQLVIVTPGEAASFDQNSLTGPGSVERVSLRRLRARNLQGIAFNPGNQNLYLLDPVDQKLYEATQYGDEVSVQDLSFLKLDDPRTMLFAPSADRTDDPNTMNLFLLDRGTNGTPNPSESLSGKGRIVELALESMITP